MLAGVNAESSRDPGPSGAASSCTARTGSCSFVRPVGRCCAFPFVQLLSRGAAPVAVHLFRRRRNLPDVRVDMLLFFLRCWGVELAVGLISICPRSRAPLLQWPDPRLWFIGFAVGGRILRLAGWGAADVFASATKTVPSYSEGDFRLTNQTHSADVGGSLCRANRNLSAGPGARFRLLLSKQEDSDGSRGAVDEGCQSLRGDHAGARQGHPCDLFAKKI